jgi:glucose-1-phosphate adenylyltransferase
VQGSTLRNSILRREVTLEKGVELEDSLILDYVRVKRGARLRHAIIGRYNVIEAGAQIGYDPEADHRAYCRTPSGIVVVPPGEVSDNLRAFSESD